MLIRIGHSPDPDDAFMFFALTAGKVKIPEENAAAAASTAAVS